MTGRTIDNVADILRLDWLTGPIFEKELRVASRRLRYYLLRAGYMLLLCACVVSIWLPTVFLSDSSVPAVVRVTQMSAVARIASGTIVWFQFIGLQLLAIVLLSNSISDEIRKRTLGVLASTPISSLQIVFGKLGSRMLQLVLLLALSFPFLSIVRGFGGVPWHFVIAGLAITMTATILAASFTLFASVSNRHAYRVILTVVTWMLFFYIVPSVIMALVTLFVSPSLAARPYIDHAMKILSATNPMNAMVHASMGLTAAAPATSSWLTHCIWVLLLSAAILLVTALRLRQAMLADISGAEAQTGNPLWRLGSKAAIARRRRRRPISLVSGDPIVWKDMLRMESRWPPLVHWLALVIALAVIYAMATYTEAIGERAFHSVFVAILVLMGLVRTASHSVVAIAAEKDSGAWPILLCTPIENRDIFWAKLRVVLRRTLPIWLVLAGHLLFFMLVGILDFLNLVAVAVIVVPSAVFLMGLGVYFGLRLKTQTAAFVAAFSIPIALWFFSPCLGFVGNPIVMSAMAVAVPMPVFKFASQTAGLGFLVSGGLVVAPSMAYAVVGLVFFGIAIRSIRRSPF